MNNQFLAFPDIFLEALYDLFYTYAMTLAFAMARISAVIQIFPLFTTVNVRGTTRAVLSFALAVPIVPSLRPEVTAIMAGPVLEVGVLLAKEFLFGIVLGGLLAIPFWGIQSAGDLIDSNRGASATNQTDPVNANEQSQVGFIFNFAALAVFVVMGGLQVVILLIYESYAVIRVGRFLPVPGPELAATLGMMLNKMLLIGIVVGGPLLIVLAVTDIALAFASRIAKQIPVNDFSGIIKNLATAAFIPLYSIFLSQYMIKDWSSIMTVIKDFLGIKIGG